MRNAGWLLALIAAAGAVPSSAPAQAHAFHVELLGPALLGSVNYEHLVGDHFSARVGVVYLPEFDTGSRVLAPIMANVLVGTGMHRLEAGGGVVLTYATSRGAEEAPTVSEHGFRKPYGAATVLYRLEPGGALKGGIYRVGITPLFFSGEMYQSYTISAGFFTPVFR
jgi:hypothetical protein